MQYFNREEAVAKWGLTTTFSGDPDEMNVRDKDLSRLITKDPTDINKIYMDLKKNVLIKGSTNLLLLLGRLLELSYDIKKLESEQPPQPAESMPASLAPEIDDKKRTKILKFQGDEKKKVKAGKHSKGEVDDSMKKTQDHGTSKAGRLKTDSTNIGKNTDWLKMKAFDVNEMGLKLPEVKLKKSTPKVPKSVSSTVSDELSLISEEENALKKKTMHQYLKRLPSHSQNVFSIYKTEAALRKNMKYLKKDLATTEENSGLESMPSSAMEQITASESSTKGLPLDYKKIPFLEPDSKFKTKHNLEKISNANEQEENHPSGTSLPKNISELTMSMGMSQQEEEEPLFQILKSLLVTVIHKYEDLKDRYQALRKIKEKQGIIVNTSDQETISLLSESEYDGGNTGEYLSSNDESDLKKVDPRHKMWHIGQNLNDDLLENQIQYTNDIRKMAILEREFLLLKRLRLAQMVVFIL